MNQMNQVAAKFNEKLNDFLKAAVWIWDMENTAKAFSSTNQRITKYIQNIKNNEL